MLNTLTQRTDQHRAHDVPHQNNHQQGHCQRGDNNSDGAVIRVLVGFHTLLRQRFILLKPLVVIFLELVLVALGRLIHKSFEVAGGKEDHQFRQRIVIGLVVRL